MSERVIFLEIEREPKYSSLQIIRWATGEAKKRGVTLGSLPLGFNPYTWLENHYTSVMQLSVRYEVDPLIGAVWHAARQPVVFVFLH